MVKFQLKINRFGQLYMPVELRKKLGMKLEAWGNETKNWIGKRLRIELKGQNVKGVMKKVIYGFPIADKVTEVPADMSAAKEEEITVTLTVREAIQLMALLSKIKAQLENDVQTTNAVHLCA